MKENFDFVFKMGYEIKFICNCKLFIDRLLLLEEMKCLRI